MTVVHVYGDVKLYILNEIDILEVIKIEKKLYIDILENMLVVIKFFSRFR